MRGKFLVALLIIALATGVTGLFASGSSSNVVKMWYWDDVVTADYRVMVREFEAANPGIKVELSVIPWDDYWTKLQTSLPTGTGPDVFWLNHPNAVSYLPTGHVMDLEPWAADINFSNFNERFYQPYSYRGKRYGVPFMWDDIVLFYNKALFDKAGIAYPNANWTWDDYYRAAQRLTVKSGNTTTQYGVLISGEMQNGVAPFIYQNGSTVYNTDGTRAVVNTAGAREAVQRQLDMINGGFAPTTQQVAESGILQLFSSGVVAMMPHLSIRVSTLAEGLGRDLRVAPLPRQQRQATIFHNIAYAAAAKTKNPEGVRKFMAFLASRRAAEIVSKTFAPCFNGMAERYFQEYTWADTRYITESINYGFPLPIASKNAGALWALADTEMSKIYTRAGQLGNQLADLENLLNAELAK